jgi:hypothetical protein
MRPLYWIVLALTVAVYATMLVWTLPVISREAAGLAAFDMRPGGYTLDEAKAFLEALTPRGRVLYLGPQHWLDLAYPLLLAIFTGWSILRLLPTGWLRRGAWLALLPIPGMIFDYIENGAVTAILTGDPETLSPQLVAYASQMTMLKSVFTSLSLTILLVLFLLWLWRRWRTAA